MKDLYIDLINHTEGVTASAVILPQLENSTLYAKRTDKICIVTKGVTKKTMNYIIAFLLDAHPVTLFCERGVFYDEQALAHVSEVIAERFEDYRLNELLARTWELIIDNNIPMEVVRNIDLHIPARLLSMYDISLGVTELPFVKMNTYKPTDLQRKDWGIADKKFMFSKDRAQVQYKYITTLYDKLIAWLQLQFYINNGIEPLYTLEEEERAELVTPYSAACTLNAYENACY